MQEWRDRVRATRPIQIDANHGMLSLATYGLQLFLQRLPGELVFAGHEAGERQVQVPHGVGEKELRAAISTGDDSFERVIDAGWAVG